MNEKQFCKCGDEGIYTALDTMTTICKSGDEWCLERDVVDAEFRCSECNGLMPEEVENKVFSSI